MATEASPESIANIQLPEFSIEFGWQDGDKGDILLHLEMAETRSQTRTASGMVETVLKFDTPQILRRIRQVLKLGEGDGVVISALQLENAHSSGPSRQTEYFIQVKSERMMRSKHALFLPGSGGGANETAAAFFTLSGAISRGVTERGNDLNIIYFESGSAEDIVLSNLMLEVYYDMPDKPYITDADRDGSPDEATIMQYFDAESKVANPMYRFVFNNAERIKEGLDEIPQSDVLVRKSATNQSINISTAAAEGVEAHIRTMVRASGPFIAPMELRVLHAPTEQSQSGNGGKFVLLLRTFYQVVKN